MSGDPRHDEYTICAARPLSGRRPYRTRTGTLPSPTLRLDYCANPATTDRDTCHFTRKTGGNQWIISSCCCEKSIHLEVLACPLVSERTHRSLEDEALGFDLAKDRREGGLAFV